MQGDLTVLLTFGKGPTMFFLKWTRNSVLNPDEIFVIRVSSFVRNKQIAVDMLSTA